MLVFGITNKEALKNGNVLSLLYFTPLGALLPDLTFCFYCCDTIVSPADVSQVFSFALESKMVLNSCYFLSF